MRNTQEGKHVENVEFLDRFELGPENCEIEKFGGNDKLELVTGEGRNDGDYCIGKTVLLRVFTELQVIFEDEWLC